MGFALVVEGESRQTVKVNADRDAVLEIRPGRNIAGACYPEMTRLEPAGGRTHRLIKLQLYPRQFRPCLKRAGSQREASWVPYFGRRLSPGRR